MLNSLLCGIVLALAPTAPPAAPATACPVMGSPASAKVATVDYAGVRYSFCCDGCPEAFAKNPTQYLKGDKVKGKTLGTFLFDPVNRKRVTPEVAQGGYLDHAGVRYYFFNNANKAAFQRDVKAYTTTPKLENFTCPISKEKLNGYAATFAYQDVDGVRYFICCNGCIEPFAKDPKTAIAGVKADTKPVNQAFLLKAGEVVVIGCGDPDTEIKKIDK